MGPITICQFNVIMPRFDSKKITPAPINRIPPTSDNKNLRFDFFIKISPLLLVRLYLLYKHSGHQDTENFNNCSGSPVAEGRVVHCGGFDTTPHPTIAQHAE
jgi:hypothetical protein